MKYVKVQCKMFNTYSCCSKELPNNLKGRSKSSQEWLTRQLRDPYIEKAKIANYRCRSAFKLLEIDSRFGFLSPGQCVVDCGAAPGSWTQVLVTKTNANGYDKTQPQGRVIAVDRSSMHPIEGATLLGNADFTTDRTQAQLRDMIGPGNLADVVVSDMAPNATGIRALDHDLIIKLAYAFVRFSLQVSCKGGTLLVKLLEGKDTPTLVKDVARFYDKVVWVKPQASRSDSSEVFVLARGFKGLET